MIDWRTTLGPVYRNYSGEQTLSVRGSGNTKSCAYLGGRLVRVVQTNSVGTTISSTSASFDQAGRRTLSVDGAGNTTNYAYLGGRLVSEVVVSSASHTISSVGYTYDQSGNVLTMKDGAGNTTSYTYSGSRLITEVVTDSASNTLSSMRYGYDLAGNVSNTTDGVGIVTSYLRDGLNVTRTLVTSGTLTLSLVDETFDLAGNVLTRTDQAGNVTSFGYLGNRVITQVDGYGTTEASTTRFGYDLAGNQTSVVDAVGNTTSYSFNASGEVTKKVDVLGTASYGYNLDGQLTLSTDQSGRKISYTYDGGRLTSEVWYNSGNTATATQNYTYDGNGYLLTAGNAAGTYTFTYDGGNLVREVTPGGLTVSFSHDRAGHVTLQTDSQGGTTSLTWQGDNLVRQTYQDGTHQARVDFTYDLAGRELSQARYADAAGATLVGSSTFGYLGHNYSAVVHRDASASVLASYGYAYDGAMRLALRVEDGASTSFNYDSRDQLTQAGSATYAWDANGNNANAGASTTTGNRLTTDGTWDYAYDGVGNVTSRTNASASVTWSYTFDNANHLLTAVQTSGTSTLVSASYAYDVFGNRVSLAVTQGGTTTTTKAAFVALGPPRVGADLTSWRLYADLNGVGAVGTRYLSGARVNQWLGQVVSGTGVRWALGDYQGSVRLVLNAAGAVINAIAYDAFGTVVSETAPSLAPRFGLAGYERDGWSGMDRAGDRYRLGLTWLTQDPLGLGPDSNPYRYVGNGPTNGVDPSGTFPDRSAMHVLPRKKARKRGLSSLDKYLVVKDVHVGGRNGVPAEIVPVYLFDFGGDWGRQRVLESIPDVYNAAYRALEDIKELQAGGKRWPAAAAVTRDRLARWFGNGRHLNAANLDEVRKVFDRVLRGMTSQGVWLESSVDTDAIAWRTSQDARHHFSDKRFVHPDAPHRFVMLGKKWFDEERKWKRSADLFHELTHLFAYTNDGPDGGLYVGDRFARPLPTFELNGKPFTPVPAVLRRLADAYDGYLTDYL